MADFERMPGETPRAYAAFQIYKNLPPSNRSLVGVSRALALERRGSGLQIVAEAESAERATKGHQNKPGRFGLWSRKFKWVERARQWDAIVDQRIRERQLFTIEKMAARHAENALIALEALMAPVWAFQRALEDPKKRADLENCGILELFRLCLSACAVLPKLQEAERIARGCKVDTNAPASPQGPSEWRVTIHQPPRLEPLLQFESGAIGESDEWEEAEITPV